MRYRAGGRSETLNTVDGRSELSGVGTAGGDRRDGGRRIGVDTPGPTAYARSDVAAPSEVVSLFV